MARPEEHVVTVRPRTILLVLGISIVVGLALMLVYLAWHVATWILIAILLAAALNPAVEAIEQQEHYKIVDRIRDAIEKRGAAFSVSAGQ
jgi:membrane protein implicated in regulation of membrane protease activity